MNLLRVPRILRASSWAAAPGTNRPAMSFALLGLPLGTGFSVLAVRHDLARWQSHVPARGHGTNSCSRR